MYDFQKVVSLLRSKGIDVIVTNETSNLQSAIITGYRVYGKISNYLPVSLYNDIEINEMKKKEAEAVKEVKNEEFEGIKRFYVILPKQENTEYMYLQHYGTVQVAFTTRQDEAVYWTNEDAAMSIAKMYGFHVKVETERIAEKYYVIKKEDVEHLSQYHKDSLQKILNLIVKSRSKRRKKTNNQYVVVNTDESYINDVIKVLKDNGHWG